VTWAAADGAPGIAPRSVRPQQRTPRVPRTQAAKPPALSSSRLSPSANALAIIRGVDDCPTRSGPTPSSPYRLRPQHHTLLPPPAQVNASPAARARALTPGTRVGSTGPFAVDVTPTAPSRLLPQQKTCPMLVKAQECDAPSARLVTPKGALSTRTGANANCGAVTPSCCSALRPQQ
jgi:hypothetical protein